MPDYDSQGAAICEPADVFLVRNSPDPPGESRVSSGTRLRLCLDDLHQMGSAWKTMVRAVAGRFDGSEDNTCH